MDRPMLALKEKVMFRRIQMDKNSTIGALKGTIRRRLIKVASYPSRQERSAITRAVCGLYCMIACVFGVVFPISDAITGEAGVHYYYTEIFHLYMFTVAIAALCYIFCDLIRKDKKARMKKSSSSIKPNDLDYDSEMVHGSHVDADIENIETPGSEKVGDNITSSFNEGNIIAIHDESDEFPDISHAGNGVNFYLRLGAVGFGLGTMLHAGFRISEPLENSSTKKCRSDLFQINAALMIIFVFIQTFFIFKHHRIVINKRKPIVRLCLMHLIATNLSLWLSAVTHETAEDIGRAPSMESSHVLDDSSGHENKTTDKIDCHATHTLSDLSAAYLYPCMIEYSLIGAAASYRIFLNVGKAIIKQNVTLQAEHSQRPTGGDECHRSTKGLFLGLLMILVTLVCVALFFVFDNSDDKGQQNISAMIFVCSEIFLMSISTIAAIVGIFMIRNLDFAGKEDETFDDKLLMVAQVGYYTLTTFVALASADSLAKSKHLPLAPLYLVMSLMSFIQITTQSFFILDGFSRCAANDHDVNRKPGRSVITFLLVTNLAMWATSTFEVRKAEVAELQVSFYSYLPWSIIMHLCLPLVIFYRFHASVCLSDIWHKAYTKRQKSS